MIAHGESYFSASYALARERFRSAAARAGAALSALELQARGPGGEPLSIDVAWRGAPDAQRVVLHTSGMHGVEAGFGAATQLAALELEAQPPAGCALVLVHVLNPYGMAWSRRVNENNVDLNRNFMLPGQAWDGAPQLYDRLERFLNPASPPGFDWFPLRALALVARHGMRAVTQAVAEGQYRHPQGLFYGGRALEPGAIAYRAWLDEHCRAARYVLALDAHTGLGRRARQTLVLEPGAGVTPSATLARALGDVLVDPARGDADYVIRGSMGAWLPHVLPAARVDFVLQEIGTSPALTVFRALREENRWHHHGSGALDHPARRALREALCPAAPAWRRSALALGIALLRAACAWAFVGSRHDEAAGGDRDARPGPAPDHGS